MNLGRTLRRLRELTVRSQRARPWVAAVAVLLFVCGVYSVGNRTWNRLVIPGKPDAPAWGMLDFRDAVYYPVAALLDGNNPYDASQYFSTYPVGNAFVLYTPMTLLVHLPFGLLPFVPSAVAFFLVSVALMVAIAHVTLRMCGIAASAAAVFALAFALVVSQPGQWNLFLGQVGALVTVAAYGALHLARRRPWLAGLCLSLAAIKPATGLPLGLLMLARREHLAVLVGIAAAVLIGGLPLIPIAHGAGGLGAFLTSLSGAYAGFTANPSSAAGTSPYRLDLAAVVSRLLGWSVSGTTEIVIMLAVVAVAALAVRHIPERHREDDRLLSASLVCVAILVCVYHPSNEALLLALPIVLMGRRCLAEGSRAPLVAWVIFAATALPAFNYLIMGSIVARMRPGGAIWLAVTSLNGVALLVAFGALCALAWKRGEAFA